MPLHLAPRTSRRPRSSELVRNSPRKNGVFEFYFHFLWLSPQDADVAVFHCPSLYGPYSTGILKVIAFFASPDLAQNPRHTVRIGRLGIQNDTALPGFRVDIADETISFRWKDMMTRFFGDELLKGTILKKLVSTFLPKRTSIPEPPAISLCTGLPTMARVAA